MRKYELWVWRILWVLIHVARPLVCRLRIEGAHHVPPTGGGVVACNHTLGPDFFFLGYASPRVLYFMAKQEAFEIHPLVSKVIRAGGVFPVQRGKSDVAALQNAVDLAKQGKLIGMFPEGTRSRTGKLGRARTGAARIALEAGVPIIPAAVVNAPAILSRWRHLRRPEVVVRFGPPIHWHRAGDQAVASRELIDQVMLAIASMVPPEQRGDYLQDVP